MTFWDWWPWYVGIGWLVGYELFSLATRIPGYPYKRLPTLSQLWWWAWDRFAWLYLVTAAAMWVLLAHFVARGRHTKPPEE